jgi:hypothetical protein
VLPRETPAAGHFGHLPHLFSLVVAILEAATSDSKNHSKNHFAPL